MIDSNTVTTTAAVIAAAAAWVLWAAAWLAGLVLILMLILPTVWVLWVLVAHVYEVTRMRILWRLHKGRLRGYAAHFGPGAPGHRPIPDYPLQAEIAQTHEEELIVRGNLAALEAWVCRGRTGRTEIWR